MSYTPEQLLEILSNYEKLSDDSLLKNAKGKEKKKLDPKAKVRNRGTVCVPAENAKDKKDHFPINDEGQARSALSRVEGLSSAPWYNGTLEGLKALVKKKVHSKYPSIGKEDKKKKSAERFNILNKLAVPIQGIAIKESLLQKYSEEGQVIDRLIAKYSQANNNAQLSKIRDNIQALQKYDAANFAPNKAPKVNNLLLHINEILAGKTPPNPDMFNTAFDQVDTNALNSSFKDTAQELNRNITTYVNSAKQAAEPPAPAGGGPITLPETTIQGQVPKHHQAVKMKAGYNVKKIQETLKARDPSVNLGPTGVDGDWGKMTEAAFQKWKATNNLQTVTDDKAIKRLMSGDNSSMQKAPAGPPAPIPAPPVVQPKAPPQQLSEVPLYINQLVQQTGQLFQQAQKMQQTVGKKQIKDPAQIQQWFQTVQHLEKQVANAKAWGNRLPQQSANAAAGAETQLRFIKDILNSLVKQTKGMG